MSVPVTELLEVSGTDALAYLDAQCTQDLSAIEVDGTAETLVLAPNGELVAYALVRRVTTERCTLEVPAGTASACIERLVRFAIRTDATFRGPLDVADGTASLRDELERIDAGIPGAAEIGRALVAHGLGSELRARCVSSTKGCYPGQELVARMESRHATPPYVLRGFRSGAACQVGDALGDPSKDGSVTSIARDDATGEWRGLCVVHRRDAALPTLETATTPPVVVELLGAITTLCVVSRLDAIVASHRERASRDARRISHAMDEASRVQDPPSLIEGLVRLHGEPLRVLAEVKRRSPSAGDLAIGLDAAALAREYARGGAAAISVLTDGPHFAGSEDDLRAVRAAVDLPVLRKDFTVSELDVADARIMGASGVLLIVAALSRAELRSFLEVADALGIDALVEVHDQRELEVALGAGALLVGVNQRDLATFEVDPTRAATLAGDIPSDVVAVAESGISDPAAAQQCAALGYDAVLVGEALVRAEDPAALLTELRAPVEVAS